MSYINEALKKAQQEREGRYRQFGGIIASGPDEPGQPRKRKLVFGAAVALIVLVPITLLMAVYALHPPTPTGGRTPPSPAVAGNPGSEPGPVLQTQEKPVSAGAAVQPGVQPPLREAESLYQEALFAQRKGNLPEAEVLYRKVLAISPDHLRTLNNLGVICLGKKERVRAITLFTRAIVLKKDYVDPYYNLACLYAQTGETEESLWYLKIAAAINPEVKSWAAGDADMRNVASSPAFKKLMEGQKN